MFLFFTQLFIYLQRQSSSMQYFLSERTTHVQPFNLDGYGVKRKHVVARQLKLREEFFSTFHRQDIFLKNAVFVLVSAPVSSLEILHYGSTSHLWNWNFYVKKQSRVKMFDLQVA